MKHDTPRAYVTNPESELPIRAVIGGREYSFALVSARKLALDLSAAVKAVDEHFQCSHPSTESVSLFRFLDALKPRFGDSHSLCIARYCPHREILLLQGTCAEDFKGTEVKP